MALELERGQCDWTSVRVIGGEHATAADVAATLFGAPGYERYVVGAGTSFSFVFPPGGALAEPYQSRWENEMIIDDAQPLDMLRARNAKDPIDGLDPAVADERALGSTPVPTDGAGAAPVLQRMDMIHATLDEIAEVAVPLGAAGAIGAARQHIEQRRQACIKNPSEAAKWNAHSSAQLDFLARAKDGFDQLTEHLLSMGLGKGASTDKGEGFAGDITAEMQGPAHEVASAFGSAVAAADQLDLGAERLAVANERLRAMPFDMVDLLLGSVRRKVAGINDLASPANGGLHQARLAKSEADLQATVAQLRMAMMNGDATATEKLKKLQSQLAALELQADVGSMVSVIGSLGGELQHAESWSPNTKRETDIQGQLLVAVVPWQGLASEYNELIEGGQGADPKVVSRIRQQFKNLSKSTPIKGLVDQVASFAEDEAVRQRWIQIGIMIAGVIAGAVTGGVASAIFGGGLIGGIAGAAFESMTFTAFVSTLRTDQTFGGFAGELLLNFATFGGLRAISAGAKIAAGGRALSFGEKLGEISLEGAWLVASAKAQEIIDGGGEMNAQSAGAIFAEQLMISLASRALGRVAAFAKLMRDAKLEHLAEVKKALAAGEVSSGDATRLLADKNPATGEQFQRADNVAMTAESEALSKASALADDPAAAAQHGVNISPEQRQEIKQLSAATHEEAEQRELDVLMAKAKPHGDQYEVDPETFAALRDKHERRGSSVVPGRDSTGRETLRISPKQADGSLGPTITLYSRAGTEVEQILAEKGLASTARVDEYLAKRARDRAGAIADLRQVKSAEELDALLEKHIGPSLEKQTQTIRTAFGTTPPSETAISELAKVPGVAEHLPALVARGPAATEALSNALAKVPHWGNDARIGLVKLVASADANAIAVFAKLSSHLDIPGTDSWTLLVARELHQPGKILDFEASLDKAIELQKTDPTVAVEVDYVNGKRVSKAERKALQADAATFAGSTYKNVDVEAAATRHEMKRVTPDITDQKKLIKQVSEGATKLTSGRVPGLKSGLPGAKKNIVDVRFDDKIKIPNYDEAALRARIEDWIANNRANMLNYVDEIAVHAEFDGKAVDFTLEVK